MADKEILESTPIQEEKSGVTIYLIWHLFKKGIIWMIICALLVGGAAFYVSSNQPTTYVASKVVLMKATITQNSTGGYNTNNTVAGKYYMSTITDFVKTQVVVKLANVIHTAEKNIPDNTFDYSEIAYKIYDNTFNPAEYDSQNRISTSGYITAGNITLTPSEQENNYFITTTYGAWGDDNLTVEQNKAEMIARLDSYIEAARVFVALKEDPSVADSKSKFFEADITFNTNLNPEATMHMTTYSKRNTILGAIIGVVLGYLLTVVIYLLDDTVKSKDELERLTGAKVVAMIEDMHPTVKNKSKKKKGVK